MKYISICLNTFTVLYIAQVLLDCVNGTLTDITTLDQSGAEPPHPDLQNWNFVNRQSLVSYLIYTFSGGLTHLLGIQSVYSMPHQHSTGFGRQGQKVCPYAKTICKMYNSNVLFYYRILKLLLVWVGWGHIRQVTSSSFDYFSNHWVRLLTRPVLTIEECAKCLDFICQR